MIRNILIATFFVTLWFGIPATAEAEQIIEVMDNNVQKVTISITESTLHITGANGEVLNVGTHDELVSTDTWYLRQYNIQKLEEEEHE